MLVKLSMKNFKSFMDKSEIDLNATGYEILKDTNKTKDNILKGALIVGGNATGKSTVLKAIKFLLELQQNEVTEHAVYLRLREVPFHDGAYPVPCGGQYPLSGRFRAGDPGLGLQNRGDLLGAHGAQLRRADPHGVSHRAVCASGRGMTWRQI